MSDRISAEELRAAGFPLPDSIPDCATTDRAAYIGGLKVGEIKVGEIKDEGDSVISVTIHGPGAEFRWVEAIFTLQKSVGEDTPPEDTGGIT